MNTKLVKAQEISTAFGLSLREIRGLVGARQIPFVRLSPRRIRFDVGAIAAWIDRRSECHEIK